MTNFAFGVLAALALVGALLDILRRTIPNWLNLLILIGGAIVLAADPGWSRIWAHLAHFIIALLVGMILYRFRVWCEVLCRHRLVVPRGAMRNTCLGDRAGRRSARCNIWRDGACQCSA